MPKYKLQYMDGDIMVSYLEFNESNDHSAKKYALALDIKPPYKFDSIKLLLADSNREINLTALDEVDSFIEQNGGNAWDALVVALARLKLAEKKISEISVKYKIEPLGPELHWYKWLTEGKNRGLEEHDLSSAVKDISLKLNQLIAKSMNSKEIENELRSEDNDLKAMGLHRKFRRTKRQEEFVEKLLPEIEAKYEVKFDEQSCRYTISSDKHQIDIIDYYPKSDKLLIRASNKWHKHGYAWLIKNLHLCG